MPGSNQMSGSESELIPHRRRTEFSHAVPEDVPPFHDQDQLNRVKATVRHARETEKLPRFWFTGPTGCGKTTAARRLALELDAPLFSVQGLYDVRKTDLLGKPTLLDGTVYWQDGPVTRALRASQEGKTVLLFDEVNRARPEAKGILFPILDGRAAVHTGRGNEVVEGDPYDLVVVVTTNEGPEYFTEQLDLAEKRRYGSKLELSYLGLADFEGGVELLVERTPVPDELARVMLTAVNETRRMADARDNAVSQGIPTSLVLEWARTAHIYDREGFDDPMMTAFRDTVLRPFYDANPDAVATIEQTVSSYLRGAPVEAAAAKEWVREDIADRLGDDSTLVENVLASEGIERETIDGS